MNTTENYIEAVGEVEATRHTRPSMKNSGVAFANNARAISDIRGEGIDAAREIFEAS
ncbi:MAG: hypothetical protein WCK39_07670 [Methanomassiliicoccales archaeon]